MESAEWRMQPGKLEMPTNAQVKAWDLGFAVA
jgi:hypothetical protein